MWDVERESLDQSDRFKLKFMRNGVPLSFREVIAGWCEQSDFRTYFSQTLADAPYAAFRWELPALTTARLDGLFECVIIDSPFLERQPNETAFARQLNEAGNQDALGFSNLGGDAFMIVPTKQTDPEAYIHLARFVRQAPAMQHQGLWQKVGEAMRERVSDVPIWLSTAGGGVAWLHVRLDSRPKYYHHAAYRNLVL